MAGQANIQDHGFLAFDDLSDCAGNIGLYLGRQSQLFQAQAAGNVPVTVQGASGQTADLIDFKNSSGTVLAKVDASGNATFASVSGAAQRYSTIASSGAIANTDTIISAVAALTVSSTLVAHSIIKITIQGTTTSSNADTQIFSLRAGTAGTTADTAICTFSLASAGSGTAVPFSATLTFVVRVPGASGTGAGSLVVNNTGATGIFADRSTVIPATTSTLATTTATNLTLSYISGASTTATTFQDVTTEILT
jgi:hypothetical protein